MGLRVLDGGVGGVVGFVEVGGLVSWVMWLVLWNGLWMFEKPDYIPTVDRLAASIQDNVSFPASLISGYWNEQHARWKENPNKLFFQIVILVQKKKNRQASKLKPHQRKKKKRQTPSEK